MGSNLMRLLDYIGLCLAGFLLMAAVENGGGPEEDALTTPPTPSPLALENEAPEEEAPEGPVRIPVGIPETVLRLEALRAHPLCGWPWPALRVLEGPPDDSAEAAVLQAMAASTDPAVRARGLEGLGTQSGAATTALESPAALSRERAQRLAKEDPGQLFFLVLEALLSGDTARIARIEAFLPSVRSALGPKMLEELTRETTGVVQRKTAAYALGHMGYAPATDTLGQWAWSRDEDLAWRCAQALAQLARAEAVPHWISLLAHAHGPIRGLAIDQLAALRGQKAFDGLYEAALGKREVPADTCAGAAAALTAWPWDSAVPALLDILEANAAVRQHTLGLLGAYTGHDFGPDPAAWRDWYTSDGRPAPPEPVNPNTASPFVFESMN